MKTKNALCLLALAVVLPSARAGTITNLVVSSLQNQRAVKTITLQANQSAKVLSESLNSIGGFELVEVIDGIRITRQNAPSPFGNLTFYGPSTVEFAAISTTSPDGSLVGLVTLEISPTSPGSVPVTNIPSNAVVIPADSAGPVTILLESSVDLITWNAANPGTYGTSTTNRFFRVRSIRN